MYSGVARDYITISGLIAFGVFIAVLKCETGFNSAVFPFSDRLLMTASETGDIKIERHCSALAEYILMLRKYKFHMGEC